MADSKTYTVEAILKATDSSFTKTMRGAMAAVNALKGGAKGTSGLFKGGISSALSFGSVMGVASAMTQKGLQAITSSVGGAVERFDTLNKYPVVMKALGYSTQDVAKSTKLLSDGIDGLPTTLSDITKSAQNFAPLTGNATKAAKAAVALNNAFLASGASVSDTSRGMQQYTQMLATGKVDMMSWRTLMETMPVALNKVAASFGYTGKSAKTDLFEALKNGEITIDQLNDKFIELNKGQKGFAELAKKNSEGIGTSFSNLKNAVVKNMANMLKAVNKGFGEAGLGSIAKNIDGLKGIINATFESISPIVTDVTKTIIQAVKDMWEAFEDTGAITALKNAFEHVKDAFEHVKKSLSGKGNIFKDLGKHIGDIVKWLSEATTGISNFISNMKPGTIKATAKAIGGVVLALKGLSILANLNPFTIIVSAIVGLVLAFAQAYNSSEKFRNGVDKALKILKEWGPAIAAVVGGFAIFKMLNGWNPFKSFASKGKSAFDGLKTAMEGGSNGAKRSKGIISQVFTGIGNVIKSFGKFFESFFKGFGKTLEGFGKGFGKAMEGIGRGMSKINPAQWLGISVAILALGAAFALMGMQGRGIATILQGLGSVIVSVGTAIGTILNMALQGLAKALVILAPVLPTIASAFAMLSPVIEAAGTAIATIISSFSGLAPVITALGSALSQVIEAISSGIAQIVEAITPIVQIISDAFVQVVTVVSDAIVQIIQAIAPFIPAISEMVQAVAPVLQSLVEAFDNLISQISPILDSLTQLFQTFGEQISSILDSASSVVESFGSAISNVLDSVAGIFESMGNAAKNAGQGVKLMAQGIKMLTDLPLGDLTGTLAAVAGGLTGIANSGIASAGPGLQQAGTGLGLIATSAQTASVAMQTLPSVFGTLSSSIGTLPGVMTTAGSAMRTFASAVMTSFVGLAGSTASISALQSRITALSASMMRAQAGASTMSASFSNISRAATSAMNQLSSAVRSAMTQAVSTMRSSMQQMVSVVRQSASQMTQAGRQAGRGVSNGVTNGIRSGIGSATAAMSAMVNAIRSTGMSGAGAMRSVGAMIGQGLAQGMYSALGAVTAAANALVAQANRAAQAKAQIHSPSRLFRDEVGYWIGAGIAVGIDKSADLAVDSISDMYDDIQSVSYKANRLLDTDFSYQLSGSYGGTMQVENPSQNKLILGLLDQLNRSLDRDIVVSVNDREIARATGDAIHNYNLKKESAMRRMRGEI
ncbi:tape measure protein [Streptococcus suis]|nr:tape measure protein [Streptococcus suis]